MVFFIIVLTIVVLSQSKFADDGGFLEDYLDKKNTTAINGIFVILILFSHYSYYAGFEGVYDYPYLCLQEHLNQMVVATFLFFSGYGMMESIKRKGGNYVLKVPAKFIKLLVRFDIAVMLFWVVGHLIMDLKYDYGINNMILTLLSWSNIGNSNWYITVILSLYIAFFVAFVPLLLKNSTLMRWLCSLLFLIVSIALVYIQIKIDRPDYYFNTIVLMPIGVFYSLIRDRVNRIVMKNNYVYLMCVVIILGIYILTYFRRFDAIGIYYFWGISFITMLLLFSMKVSIYNSLLEWFGEHIFSIYILQRLPMIVLRHYGCINSHKYICLIIAIISTALIAITFEYFVDKLFDLIGKGTKQLRKGA